jgi:hypothetical protein
VSPSPSYWAQLSLMQYIHFFVVFTSPDLAASIRYRQTCRRKQNVSRMCFVLPSERHWLFFSFCSWGQREPCLSHFSLRSRFYPNPCFSSSFISRVASR